MVSNISEQVYVMTRRWELHQRHVDKLPIRYTLQCKVKLMNELYKALGDISSIRRQMASTTEFRGYGPATLAATGFCDSGSGGTGAVAA